MHFILIVALALIYSCAEDSLPNEKQVELAIAKDITFSKGWIIDRTYNGFEVYTSSHQNLTPPNSRIKILISSADTVYRRIYPGSQEAIVVEDSLSPSLELKRHLQKLMVFLNRCQCERLDYSGEQGNIAEIHLDMDQSLYYLPDSSVVSEEHENLWKRLKTKGEHINKSWWLLSN